MRMAALALTALALTACGAARHARPGVSARIDVGSHAYSLTCGPAGGSIPYASRLCRDIAQHPTAMLAPERARSVCSPPPGSTSVTVSSARGTFAGIPSCNWPGGTALQIYDSAVQRDAHTLGVVEPRLRCDDDPELLAKPTPWRSVFACTHGLWTPRTERLIALAAREPQLAALGARKLFPRDIGTEPCTFEGGGLGLRTVHGSCEVNVTHVWELPEVRFTEAWAGGRSRHTWVVTILGTTTQISAQHGQVPPQLWE